jgi:peptidoglycan/LPS O-acetylase OafA/YrhL
LNTSTSIATSDQAVVNRKFEFSLEGLRGFAALVVVLGHTTFHPLSLDSAFTPSIIYSSPFPGHLCVLIFFILSGYVIGLTNKKPLIRTTIIPYLRKRIIRIYPIYIISLLLTLSVITRPYPFSVIAGHFLFLQNSVVSGIWENNPLWSLNNEVIYYLAFIPLSYLRLSPGRVLLGAGLLGIICGTVIPMPLVSSYSFGFVFWVSGLWLAQFRYLPKQYSSRWLLFGLLCLFLGYGVLNPFTTAAIIVAVKLGLNTGLPNSPSIQFSDLAALPFCFYVFLRFTNHTVKGGTLILAAFVLSVFAYYAHMVYKYGIHSPQALYLLLPIISVAIGSAFLIVSLLRPPSIDPVLPAPAFLKLGAISYGIYVIHFPLSIMLSHIPYFSGSALSFSVRLVIHLLLVLGAGYLLELKIQPWFKARFS